MESISPLYDKFLNQCKAADVDTKVDGLAKLQLEFEKGAIQVPDAEALISVLKPCLRASNIHLCNATLSALPVILPSLIIHSGATTNAPLGSSTSTAGGQATQIDVHVLRQVMAAFLPTGGLIDRLGDKERAMQKAREALVLIGGYAFRAGGSSALSFKQGKGPEPPIMAFERALREGGLASKVWKVREQSIITLIHIRRSHHMFPLRAYLTPLVDCLEDTDPHVRDCARTSVVELFTGPGVTDAARADLKKELTKKNVRKAIVDDVLSKLLSGTAQGSVSTPDGGPEEYIPPSLMLAGKGAPRLGSSQSGVSRIPSQQAPREIPGSLSRAAMVSPPPSIPSSDSGDVNPVYIASGRDLENEFAAMAKSFDGKETEHNWAAREQAVQRVRGMIKGDVHIKYTDVFFTALKDGFMQWSLKTLASLRTTVATNTCALYMELSAALGTGLDPFCDLLFTNLLKMAGFTKKITAEKSQNCVSAIIESTTPQPRIVIGLLWQTLQEKTVQARAYAVGHLRQFLRLHGQKTKGAIEASGTLEVVEKALKKALGDPNPSVRETSRLMYWDFEAIWQDQALTILDTLDATARKQVEKACPSGDVGVSTPITPGPATKKSSVAAAIAASRAKAKAIATAPPTLRHQATSASRPVPLARSGSFSPNQSTPLPGAMQRTATSPSPPRSRITSSTITKPSGSPPIRRTHSRTPSGSSDKTDRAPSPSLSDQGVLRRAVSPLSTSQRISKVPVMGHSPPPSKFIPTSRSPPPPTRIASRSPPRSSLAQLIGNDDESLLLAQQVPVPDSDSEDDLSVDLMSFSAPYEKLKSGPSGLTASTESPPPVFRAGPASVSDTFSTESMSDLVTQQPVVEDALRARAEQAQSAAERLLELVEPDDDLQSTIPPSLLKSSNGQSSSKPKGKPNSPPMAKAVPPSTPPKASRAALIMKQAALFTNSPVKGNKPSSLLDVLQPQKAETTWWLKRKILISRPPVATVAGTVVDEINAFILALKNDTADLVGIKRLVMICMDNTVSDLSSPPLSPSAGLSSSPTPGSGPTSTFKTASSRLWESNKLFDRLFDALLQYLQPARTEDELAHGLMVVWEMISNQAPFIEGKEGDIFAMLLRVRFRNKLSVLEGTNAIRDAFTSKLDPVYGLTTFHGTLRVFDAEPLATPLDAEIKASTYAYGLMVLGKFILRLPAEIAEEELPRLKGTLITSLNNRKSLLVRESAAACIIAAQLVLRDETHLFALLDGLPDDKKNLLTYLFDKHGVRNPTADSSDSGIDKLEKELRRLDTRTSTPMR